MKSVSANAILGIFRTCTARMLSSFESRVAEMSIEKGMSRR